MIFQLIVALVTGVVFLTPGSLEGGHVNFLVVMGAPPRLIGINSVNLNHFKLPISLFLYWFNQFNAPLSSFPAAVDRFNRQVVALS